MTVKRSIGLMLLFSLLFSMWHLPADSEEDNKLFNFGNTQGAVNISGDNILLSTNGEDIYQESDRAVFYLVEELPFLYGDLSTAEITATINDMQLLEGAGDGAGAFGIMLRNGLEADDANVFFRIAQNKTNGLITRRGAKGSGSSYTGALSGITLPITLKLKREGNNFMAYILKNDEWVLHATVACAMGNKVYAGLAGFSHVSDTTLQASFSNVSATVDNSNSPDSIEYVEKETAYPGLLLRENFDDASLVKGEESVLNPIWSGAPEYFKFNKSDDGNISMVRDGSTTSMVTGDKMWYDYEASVEVSFDKVYTKNIFQMLVRCQRHKWFGNGAYIVGFKNGNMLHISKQKKGRKGLETTLLTQCDIGNYIDTQVKLLKVQVVDNVITVYLNGEKKLSYMDNDDLFLFLSGGIGLYTQDAGVTIDNVIVKEISDYLGDKYDNILGHNYNMPTTYLKKIIISQFDESLREVLDSD